MSKKVRWISVPILFSILAIFAITGCGSTKEVPFEGPMHLVVLASSDLHGNILGFSYEDNKPTTNNGMTRLYTYIEKVRGEGNPVVLIDAGDDIQGTIMTDDLYNKTPKEPHPIMQTMNYFDYDAMSLGNHEFNWGIKTMQQITGQGKFPILAANVVNKKTGKPVTGKGWTMIKKAGLKIAVIGCVTPNVPIWDGDKQGIEDYDYLPGYVAVRNALAEINGKADIVIVSVHMGLEAEFDEEGGADSAQKILDENPGIDILHVAHYHIVVNEKQGNTVIGGVRDNGRDLARFDLEIDANKKITNSTVQIVDMKDYEPHPAIAEIPLVKESHERTIDFIQGGGSGDGESGGASLGITTKRFQPENEIRGLPEGKLRDTAVIALINKIQMEASGADVSGAALFKRTSDLPEGNINYLNIFDIYKFYNTLYRVPVTGAELKTWMEWSAECYNQWKPGDINISFDPEYPDYLYDMFAGVDYEIDLSQPKGSRIKNVMFKGHPLRDDEKLTIAVNNYRYSSALRTRKMVSSSKEWESSGSIRDLIVKYFAEHSPVNPDELINDNWHITGVDLSKNDPRRAEIIKLVNEGKLEPPYAASYNLKDYNELIRKANGN